MRSRVSPAQLAAAACCPNRSRGFTIVEAVLVIVILAVLATVAGPRFFNDAAFDERGYYDELVSALRYAQKVAVASGCRVRVNITATTFSLAQQAPSGGHCDPADASYPVQVRLSTGEIMSGTAPGNVTAAPAMSLVFDALGRTNLGTNQIITVGSRSLTVQADSGLVVTP